MIEVRDVVARYGHFWLREVNLSIAAGECFALIGPSGAGKTLLLETIMGVKPPTRGRILLGGADITRAAPEERHFSYVPQDLALFPHLSVRDNVGFGLRIRNAPRDDVDQRVRSVAAMLGIESLLSRRDVRSLSGGEKQRVALARALVVEPRVLFLDEPFGALDTSTRRQLHVELRDVQRRLGLTTVLVTHDHDEAFALADRIGVMIDGGLEQVGDPRDVFDNPLNLRVARFLLVENLWCGQCVGRGPRQGELRFQVGDVELAVARDEPIQPGQSFWLGVRAQDVTVTPDDSAGSCWPAESGIPAVVEVVRRHTDRCTVIVRSRSEGVRLESASVLRDGMAGPERGQRVRVTIPPRRVLLFPQGDPTAGAARPGGKDTAGPVAGRPGFRPADGP
ncbi:MAG: hypothetical protein AMXMBFR83_20240 [Phycisphaerae bacterium]